MATRRTFIQITLGGLAALITALFARESLAAKLAVSLDKLPKLKKVGGSVVVVLKGKQVLLIRDSQSTVKAFSPVCTHQQCIVAYSAASKTIDCGCHRSSYDLKGRVLGGPAPKPLPEYFAKLDGQRIIIDLK